MEKVPGQGAEKELGGGGYSKDCLLRGRRQGEPLLR